MLNSTWGTNFPSEGKWDKIILQLNQFQFLGGEIMKVILYLSIPFVLAGCGQNQTNHSETEVVNGIEATADEFPSVVKISHGNSGCSASFVTPKILLTAAHCLEGSSAEVRVGDHATRDYHIHPRYNQEWWKHDIAVVRFSQDISEHFVPIADQDPEVGDEVTIVGFGINDLYGNSTGFIKRYGYNNVERVGNGRVEFRGRDLGLPTPDGTDALSGSGDSGGPMIANGKQVGVCSAISVEPRGNGRNGYYTSINYPENRAFVDQYVTQAE
jgi:secreted trypsin-like serine protease